MKIGLIDVDNWKNLDHCFPNLPLMKLSAYHKLNGDCVEFVNPLKRYDVVYQSKVFSFSEPVETLFYADKIIYGGSGYQISINAGRECYDNNETNLPAEIEHIYPDYGLYGINDTAYGFLTRGCPRKCAFCHVAVKEKPQSYKVANLSEFWRGQKKNKLA